MGARIAVGQFHSRLYDVDANLEKAASMAAGAHAQGARLVLLPETFPSGYDFGSKKLAYAQPIPGPITDFLCRLSAEHNLYIYGSMIEKDGGSYHNAAPFISPQTGIMAVYRKVHPFGEEKDVFKAGSDIVLVDTDLGRLGLTICMDLCFPEYIRGLVLNGAEYILNTTNWISVGPPQDWDIWEWDHTKPTALAVARALENTVGLAMCCQGEGLDGSIYSFGCSVIVGPSGRILAQLGRGEGVTSAEIPMDRVGEWRAIATYLADRQEKSQLYRRILGYEDAAPASLD
jgi:predicted amidohydrolase